MPGEHVSLRVEARLKVDQRRRPLRIPAVLVRSRPLHPHRPPNGPSHEHSVACCVLVSVAPVTARALDVDAAHRLGGHSGHCGKLLAQSVRHLRGAPAGQLAILDLRHGAGGTD